MEEISKNPLVSIIIPVYNRLSLVIATLDSIQKQTYASWECIIVDDGSTDGTLVSIEDFIKKDKRFVLIQRPAALDKGANTCRNIGLEKAKGVYVQWFDSDDLMLPELLSSQLKTIERKNSDFSICRVNFFSDAIPLISRGKPFYSDNLFEDYISRKVTVMTPSILWSKSFLSLNKLRFKNSLQAAQEWDFISRAFIVQFNAVENTAVLIDIRQHENSISYNPKKLRIRESYYLLARKLFYIDFKDILTDDVKNYFEIYFTDAFKKRLRLGWVNESFHSYLFILKHFFTFRVLSIGTISLCSFAIFQKGEFFIKYLKINKPSL